MIQLRPYQQEAVNRTFQSWQQGNRNVLNVLPTGAGKTVVATTILNQIQGFKFACAHRQELVSQISVAFGRLGVPHRLFAPKSVISDIRSIHRDEFGRTFVDQNAATAVGGVDTVRARHKREDSTIINFLKSVNAWFVDEAHHVTKENKWGQVATWCPNAYGLGVTATPLRADGKGLGAANDGIFHDLLVGPNMRDLINQGHLCEYAPPICPPSDLVRDNIAVGGTGDFTQAGLKKAARESHIVGDVVTHYMKFASRKLGITFATDVETAGKIADQFNQAGIPAAMVSGETPELMRHQIIKRFKNRELLMLVNVDLFGEGFDLPALEVVIMARPTQSYGLYVQQFGRVLRNMGGKTHGIIIDHVDNVRTHGLPDNGKPWTLDRKQKRGKSENTGAKDIPVTRCENPECFKSYPAITPHCPHCGHVKSPANRSQPKFVDGDLKALSPEAIAKLRGEVANVDRTPAEVKAAMEWAGYQGVVVNSRVVNHKKQQGAQVNLRNKIAQWAGYWKAQGYDDSMLYRRFYHEYGVDIATAMTLSPNDVDVLLGRITF